MQHVVILLLLIPWLSSFFVFLLFGFQTAQTVLVVVVVFCLSWLPHHVVHLWAEFGTFPLNQASFVLRVAAHCLAYSNSSVNPVIYAFLSENFRKAYKQVFKCQTGASNSPLNDIKEIRSKADTAPSTNCTNVWLSAAGARKRSFCHLWYWISLWVMVKESLDKGGGSCWTWQARETILFHKSLSKSTWTGSSSATEAAGHESFQNKSLWFLKLR